MILWHSYHQSAEDKINESNYTAGGESRRFGRPKAFAEVEGQMFYQRIIKVLESTNMFNDIVISTNNQLKINLTIRMWL